MSPMGRQPSPPPSSPDSARRRRRRSPSPPPLGRRPGRGRGMSSPPLASRDRTLRPPRGRSRGRGWSLPPLDLSLALLLGEPRHQRNDEPRPPHVLSSPPVYYGATDPHGFPSRLLLSSPPFYEGSPAWKRAMGSDASPPASPPANFEAVADANKAIELDPSMHKAYLRKGSACIKLEEYQTAKAALEVGSSYASGDSRFTRLMKECDDRIAVHREKPTHLRFLVSNAAAGCIIGKGGSTVKGFQSLSGARIQVSHSNEFFPGTIDRIIMVSGLFDEVVKAMELILEKLLSEGELRLVVPNSSYGGIIGEGGATIKSFIEDSHAGIKISPQDNNFVGLHDRLVIITGPFKSQMLAINLILSKLSEDVDYPPNLLYPFSYAGVSVLTTMSQTGVHEVYSTGGRVGSTAGRCFTIEELNAATDMFDSKKSMPVFGPGVILGNHGLFGLIAISSFLKSDIVEALWRCSERTHPNIAVRIGYCSDDKFYIVYDFQYKCSLKEKLQEGDSNGSLVLLERINIALDILQGIRYIMDGDTSFLPRLTSEIIWLRDSGAAVIVDVHSNGSGLVSDLIKEFGQLMTEILPPSFSADGREEILIQYQKVAEECLLENLPAVESLVKIRDTLICRI